MQDKKVRSWKERFASVVVPLVALLGGVFVGGKIAQAAATTYDGNLLIRAGYDYAPSVMVDSDGLKMWWCGTGAVGDEVFYSKWNGSAWSTPQSVLQRTNSSTAWDRTHACDPSVVKGSFNYGGTNYAYAMYYSGTYDSIGYDTHIGVAFSNNGTSWVKHPNPVAGPAGSAIPSTQQYGAGMQSAYRANGTNSNVTLAYFDSTQSNQNVVVTSTDGINFSNAQLLPNTGWHMGDITWSPSEGVWYIAVKSPTDTDIAVWRSTNSSITSGWSLEGDINSASTGKVRNHNPGFMRLQNGDAYIEPGTGYKKLYFGRGDNASGTWDLAQATLIDGWEFNILGNTQGWTQTNTSGHTPNGNAWIFTGANDPHVDSPDLLIRASEFGRINILMANNSSNPNAQIFFRTSTSNFYSEDKSVPFTVSTNGSWSVYSINMKTNPNWTGWIRGIRVDPTGNGNNQPIGIDYIRVAR